MDDGLKLENSTGSTPSMPAESEKGKAPPESTESKKDSPVSSSAPTKAESTSSTVEASHILALQVLLGDFRALKNLLAESWTASSNGKIYWCAQMPGHDLSLADGNLLVDGEPASRLLEKLIDE
jgi:hypothetical protein